MDAFFTPAPRRTQDFRVLNGDQEAFSFDTSLWREGSGWNAPVGSDLYVLMGNQLTMKTWTHNFALDANCKFLGRDDAGACMLWAYGEDEIFRWFGAPTGAKGTAPVFTLYATYNSLTGVYTSTGLGGTTTNNNAPTGSVGELISATIATPGTSLTTATPANVITTPFLSLTAGDWDVWGEVCFLPAATTSITQIAMGISPVSATLPAAGSGLSQETHAALVPGAIPQCFDVIERRVSINATTPYYLVAQAAFSVSTLTVFGTLYARRRR